MIRILVVSDTHLDCMTPGLPYQIIQEINNCDLVIHAGDFTREDVYHQLSSLADVVAVCGNMDDRSIREQLPIKRQVVFEHVTLGVIHGRGSPQQTLKYARSEFTHADLIIFGHSHTPFNEEVDGVWMFNPGSPTYSRNASTPTYGVIELDKGKMRCEIKPVK